MITQPSTAPEATSSRYLNYLREVYARGASRAQVFETDACGAFIQDNFVLLFRADFEHLRSLFRGSVSPRLVEYQSDEPIGGCKRAFIEVNPSGERNRLVLQLLGRLPELFGQWYPDFDSREYQCFLSVHGGRTGGGNREHEKLGCI